MKEYTSAISRAIAIIDWISSCKDGSASVLEMASKLKIPRASAYRIVNELSEWGVLEYDAMSKRYRLGPKVLHFARSFIQRNELIKIADPSMVKLRDSTNETVSLNIPLGGERICIHEIRSSNFLKWAIPPGTRAPLYPGASGKCILAFMQPDKAKAVLEDHVLMSETGQTQLDADMIMRELENVRLSGYCTSVEEVHTGAAAVAAPILNEEGYSVGCITLTAPLARWNEEIVSQLIPQTVECATSVSNAMMYRQVE